MNKIFISMLLVFLVGPAYTQSLQDQISAVNQAQNQRKATEKMEAEQAAAEERSRQLEADRRQAAREARDRQLASEKIAQADRDSARKAELEKAQMTEMKADKSRDQSYEDELRQLEIEEKRIALAEKKAKADRANDYIDQELKQKAATTDVIQSNADVNRNVSEGAKDLLTSEGKAKEKEASRLFR
jgi:hypothetical protein